MHELAEREKELDCLYKLAHLLIEFQGEEENLLESAGSCLLEAMSNPENCRIHLGIVHITDDSPKRFSAVINNREKLVLSICFPEENGILLEREESLLLSALELLAESIVRIRLEKKIESKNHALSELIEQLSESKHRRNREMERRLYAQIFPSLERLKSLVPEEAVSSIDLVKMSIRQMIGSDSDTALPEIPGLSPRELEICGLIQYGMDTKSIAHILHISMNTVERHRCTIRKKLGLSGTGQNLHNFLINL